MFCRLNGPQQQFGTISSQRIVIAERLDDSLASFQPFAELGAAVTAVRWKRGREHVLFSEHSQCKQEQGVYVCVPACLHFMQIQMFL